MGLKEHTAKVQRLQETIRKLKGEHLLSFQDPAGHSNTTRTKSYKGGSAKIDVSDFHGIVEIDPVKQIAIVEPRVTMEDLVKATLPYGLVPPVIPEFKGITVGGAIMGGAGESSSHKWGLFNDVCTAFELIGGNGELLRASPEENSDLFYGNASSYGSLGTLVTIEMKLIPAKEFVHLRYHSFHSPKEAIAFIRMQSNSPKAPEFLDGIVFSKDHAVVIEGEMKTKDGVGNIPRFSLGSPFSDWYFAHAQRKENFEEVMELSEYLFRFDKGAFWMGAYLFRASIFTRFIGEGVLHLHERHKSYTDEEIRKFSQVRHPNLFFRTLFSPFMTSQRLWALFHKAEKWIKHRSIIQDFCLPEHRAGEFLEDVMEDPGTFPLWLCPIKGTRHPQIFSPHLVKEDNPTGRIINIGIYGLPRYFTPIEEITKKLEMKTKEFGGRKVLYSHSYYTPEEFWQIYSREEYEKLRMKTKAKGVFHEITDKVLSE